MKAARNKIAEEAKQRDCTQRMESQLLSVDSNVVKFIQQLYDIQTHTARKPLAKIHSVLVEGSGKLFVVNFEIHKVVVPATGCRLAGDDDLNHLDKAFHDTIKDLDFPSDLENVHDEVVVNEGKDVDNDDN